ncbi:DNA (cytosine-5)-methyltransferase DRM1A-like [Cornus florida]|uniref:DNA (cytosine-5)-methyltransferase DRM1A-like n=1 Tax=Cornus florida TaxID=4283 RepID=UPI00289E9E58|nr:DNA (cytosine-5)-methyltransferase DRM1A-like [Cornus florida]
MSNQNQGFDGEESWNGLPVQTDECLALMVKRECKHLPSGDYLNRLRNGDLDLGARMEVVDWIVKVDTVAYHLSVLKDLFPGGINLLSLFSGIDGAEVALHRLGIPLKNVVSVEISEVNRNIVRCWWEQTNQKGNLIDLADVQQLNGDRLEELMNSFGGFDLVVGGSPCNNLAGSKRLKI